MGEWKNKRSKIYTKMENDVSSGDTLAFGLDISKPDVQFEKWFASVNIGV